jgi:putative phosphoribosyl transferase
VYFRNRTEAGQVLANRLQHYKGAPNLLVLGLPRGGVPVAHEVARELNAPLDVFTVRKLGVPGHEELGMGAIASGGLRILHDGIIRELGISQRTIDMVSETEARELERRERIYRGDHPAPPIKDRTVIIVDDGLATGSTMKAAVRALRQQNPARLIAAVPTAPAEACEQLREIADEVICAVTPDPFFAVGGSYGDFHQVTDDEVRKLIQRAGKILSGVSQ